ncbi:MAG TPA: universal stress protein [Gemmataceae bacterium]|jgi:nucleotide-binding universal stress UspA family protein
MISIRRILAPTDFSDNSTRAVRYAAELAAKFEAELVLLHVVQDLALVLPDAVMPTPVATPNLDDMIAAAKTGIANLVGSLNLGALNPKAEVRVGSPATEIVAAAADLKADLLCVSTHGRTGLAHFLLGSVAEKIVRHAPCPVLSVRPKCKQLTGNG